MKLVEKSVEVVSNIEYDESHAISIDESAISMVIERLISTYSNPYRAALREYTSNAYDEHVASGQTLPVEVSLPDALSPVLKVQDFGRGLSREELKGYGTIGTSTKRDSNEMTGGFGLGSKTALAASSQFTVISVKDGKRNTVIVARDEHNRPHMNFLPEAETDDPSGTTVIVPISGADKFGDLTDFWVGWKPGSILINGREPERSVYNPDNFETVGGGIAYNDKNLVSSGMNNVRVLINQVFYRLSYRAMNLSYSQWNLLKYTVIRLDNGSVDIAPSREDLLYNNRTKAAILERVEAVLQIASKSLADSVQNAETLRSALTIRESMKSQGLPVSGLRWKGLPLVLPGDTVKGNKVPSQPGTWATPLRDPKTKSGYRVERTPGNNAHRPFGSLLSGNRRLIIVHGAGAPVKVGRSSKRLIHREAYSVTDFIRTLPEDDVPWELFITSEPLSRLNRVVLGLAHSVISAEHFNSVAEAFKAKERESAKKSGPKSRADYTYTAITPSTAARPDNDVFVHSTLSEIISGDYDHTIILRNLSGGLDQTIRDAVATKRYRNPRIYRSVLRLVRAHNAVILLLNKNDDISSSLSDLPPVTTVEELAVLDINKGAEKKKTPMELRAELDHGTVGGTLVSVLSGAPASSFKDKTTREWVKALSTAFTEKTPAYEDLRWLINHSKAVASAFAAADSANSDTPIPDSPLERYPLLPHILAYRVSPSAIIDYINLVDASRKS